MHLFDAQIMAKELMSMIIPEWRFAWDNKKTINGSCSYKTKTIYLSRHLTSLRTRDAVRLTIQHEIAHAINPGKGHGPEWKTTMRSWGLPADRCSQDVVDRSSISNWFATCPGCGKVSTFIRKPRIERSCGACSGKVYNPKYALTFKKR